MNRFLPAYRQPLIKTTMVLKSLLNIHYIGSLLTSLYIYIYNHNANKDKTLQNGLVLLLVILIVYCHLQRYKSCNCWLNCLLNLADISPMMQLLCLCRLITQYLWVLSTSLHCLMRLHLQMKKRKPTRQRMKKQGACKCVACHHQLYIYVCVYIYIFSCESLSVVGQKINMTHAEVFPGSQVLYASAGWVIMPSTWKSSISLLVLPLCLWEWCEALSRVLETHSLLSGQGWFLFRHLLLLRWLLMELWTPQLQTSKLLWMVCSLGHLVLYTAAGGPTSGWF